MKTYKIDKVKGWRLELEIVLLFNGHKVLYDVQLYTKIRKLVRKKEEE